MREHGTKNFGLKEYSNFNTVIINNIKIAVFKVIKKYEKDCNKLSINM